MFWLSVAAAAAAAESGHKRNERPLHAGSPGSPTERERARDDDGPKGGLLICGRRQTQERRTLRCQAGKSIFFPPSSGDLGGGGRGITRLTSYGTESESLYRV